MMANLEQLAERARRLRIHSLRTTTKAGSGHPTSCLSCAEIMAALFFHAMRFDPANPNANDGDRFVLSKGHAAPVLYAALAEAGVFPVARLETLREFASELEGHPTPLVPGVDAATGSLDVIKTHLSQRALGLPTAPAVMFQNRVVANIIPFSIRVSWKSCAKLLSVAL